MALWPGHPVGEQWETAVVQGHRGHRLGLLVKAEMALRLAREEPSLRSLHTWNAEDNVHMLAVNDRLGWRPCGTLISFEGPLDGL